MIDKKNFFSLIFVTCVVFLRFFLILRGYVKQKSRLFVKLKATRRSLKYKIVT